MRFLTPAKACARSGLRPGLFYASVYPGLRRLRAGGRVVLLDLGSEGDRVSFVVKGKGLGGYHPSEAPKSLVRALPGTKDMR